MPGTFTNGFDVVLELSEARIAQVIRTFYVREFPDNRIIIPDSATGLGLDIIIDYRLPETDAISVNTAPGNRVTVTLNLTQVRIRGYAPAFSAISVSLEARISILGGEIRVEFTRDPIVNIPTDEFNALIEFINAILTGLGRPVLAPEAFLSMVQSALRTQIEMRLTSLPRIPIGTAIGISPCGISVRAVELVTLENSAFLCLALGGAGIPARTLNPAGFSASHLNGQDSALMIANDALLSAGICYLTSLPESPYFGAVFTGTGDCRTLSGPFDNPPIGGFTFRTERMSVCVEMNTLVARGRIVHAGTGYRITADFEAPVTFRTTEEGFVLPVINPDLIRVVPFVEFEWWVYALGIAAVILLPIISPLLAALVAMLLPLIGPIASAIAAAVVRSLLPTGIALLDQLIQSGYSMLPPEVLMILGALRVQRVELDDLEMTGALGQNILRPRVSLPAISNTLVSSSPDPANTWMLRVSKRYVYEARPFHFPEGTLRYQWYINGRSISGSGTAQDLNRNPVQYSIRGNQLTITNPEGVNSDLEIAVRVTAANGLSLFFARNIALEGMTGNIQESPFFERLRLQNIWVPRGPMPCPDPIWRDARLQSLRPMTARVAEGMNLKPEALQKTMDTIRTSLKLR